MLTDIDNSKPVQDNTLQIPSTDSAVEDFEMGSVTPPANPEFPTNAVNKVRRMRTNLSEPRLSVTNYCDDPSSLYNNGPIVEGVASNNKDNAGNTIQINIVRPTSTSPLPRSRQTAERRRFSTYVRPTVIEPLDNVRASSPGGQVLKVTPRRSSISVIGQGGKFLYPSEKNPDFISPSPSQYQRTRRISFGGVPKSSIWGVSRNDDDDDSEDSLLAPTSRKESKSFHFRGPTLMGYNKRQWHYLIIFALVEFTIAVVTSIQGPLYPPEAERKGVTPSEYGFVFGVFELTNLLVCPLFGKLIGKIRPQVLFNAGIFTTGICVILFGSLTDIEDTATFLTLSFTLRIIEAIGNGACMTAAYSIINSECPDTVSTTFIFLRIFFGIGSISGPIIGGMLSSVGGFSLPFGILGMLQFCSGIFTFVLLPKPNSNAETTLVSVEVSVQDKTSKTQTDFLALLKSPTVILASFSIVSASLSMGFLTAALEPHIREFTSSATTVGLVYVLNGASYSISSAAWGWGCHVVTDPKYITLVGALLNSIAFSVIGPLPFLPIDTYFWLTCLGLIVDGLGIAAVIVSAFLLILRDTIARGQPDNEATYGLVSGLYTSLFTLGNAIGSSISGVLVDNFGFRWASVPVLALQVLTALLVICFIIADKITSFERNTYSDFDDESFSALQVSIDESMDEWDDPKDNRIPPVSYGATTKTNTITNLASV